MVDKEFEPRTIRIAGSERNSFEIERYREFICYGRKNIEEVCGSCKLRFACFSTRDDIEIPVGEFRKKSIRDVTVKMITNKFSGLKYKFRKGLDSPTYKTTANSVQINFKKVVKK